MRKQYLRQLLAKLLAFEKDLDTPSNKKQTELKEIIAFVDGGIEMLEELKKINEV